jgi:cytochrome c
VLFVAAVVAISLAACGKPASQSADSSASAPTAPAPEQSPAEKQAVIAALPAPYNTGDYLNGKSKFALCASCHSIAAGGPNMTGPHLHGVFGRKAGSVESFHYSDAVKAAGFTWDADHLDKWIANPREFIPGTKMSFIGLKDPKDRIDVIAYLKAEGGDAAAN